MLGAVLSLLNIRKNKILLLAEAALPERQFAAFKKVFLDELGMRGFEGDFIHLLNQSAENPAGVGMGRNRLSEKGGATMIEKRTNPS
jgi:hypothetical protein